MVVPSGIHLSPAGAIGPAVLSRLTRQYNTTQHRSRSASGARPSGTELPFPLYSRPRAPWQVDVPCGLVGASPQGAGQMSSVSALTSAFMSVMNRGHQTNNFGREIITTRDAEAAIDLLSGLTKRGPFHSGKMPADRAIRNPPAPGRCYWSSSVKPLNTSIQRNTEAAQHQVRGPQVQNCRAPCIPDQEHLGRSTFPGD